MEVVEKIKGRPRKTYAPPEEGADEEVKKMYRHYMALKKAQRDYYQRNKERLKQERLEKLKEANGGQLPRRGRPSKTQKN